MHISNTVIYVDILPMSRATVAELVETEEEFIKDLKLLLNNYYKVCDQSSDKSVSESRDVIFGSLVKIAEFHEGLLLEGLKSNSESSKMVGRCFLRLVMDYAYYVDYTCIYIKARRCGTKK